MVKTKKKAVSVAASYEEKWSRLNRNMRWEVADLLRERDLAAVNEACVPVVPRDTFYVRHVKRAIDVVGSVFALLITAPINLVVAFMTLITLGMPIVFKQRRLGKDGELFTLVKFRNMREEFDENGHPLPGSLRVTRLGKFMRRTSLDELLNFWSILKGDMSLIGPRPLVPEYGPRYSDRHRQRMSVKPGLECPARSRDIVIADYTDQFENDVWYVENVSFRTDLMLTWRLVYAVFDRRQSKRRSAAKKGSFLGYRSDGRVVDSHSVPEEALETVLRRHGLLIESDEEVVKGLS